MTDVGKIKFGVEVDADDLSAQLGEAVRAAVAPALAKIQQSLQKVQHEYNETGKSAEKSAVKQVAALKAVEQQANKTRDALVAARAAAFSPGSGNGGSGNGGALGHLGNDNRKYDNRSYDNRKYDNRSYDNRKIDNSRHTDNRRYDQRKYDYRQYDNRRYDTTYDYSTHHYNGGPPTPGPGNGGPSGGGGGGGKGGGPLGFLTSPVGLNGIALGAAALPALATGLTNIVGSVQQLVQAGLVLPGLFAGAGASIGTAVIGFNGIADATKAMNDALKSGDPKDIKKFEEATKDMAPAGKELAKTFAELNRGPLLEFRKNIQGRMLDGFASDVRNLSDKALPHLDKGIGGIADSWKGTLKAVTGGLGSDRSLSLMDQIFGNTAEGQKRANAAIGPLINAMGTLAKEGSAFLPRLGDGITKVSQRFEAWVTKNERNGNMFRWIDEGLNGLRAFGNAILNVVQTITGLTKAAGQLTGSLSGDGGFLGWLERATGNMNKFVNSVEGQGKLGEFFKGGREDLAKWGQILGDIFKILGHVLEGFATWGKVILPIVGALANVVSTLGEIPGLLEAIVVGFLAWRTLGPIITGLTTKLAAMGTATGGAGGGLKAIRGQLALGAGAAGLGFSSQAIGADKSDTSNVLGILGSGASGALLGAGIGSMIAPGIGTAAGAAIGAVGGTIAGVYQLIGSSAQKSADEAATAAAKHQAALASIAATARETAAAQANLTDALVAANGSLADAGGAVSGSVQASLKALREDMKPEDVEKFDQALAKLGLTETALAGQVTGSQQTFDALIGTLNQMGPVGQNMAASLIGARDSILGASDSARIAAPLYQNLAAAMGVDVTQAAANVKTALDGIPSDVPIDVKTPNGAATLKILEDMKVAVTTLPEGVIGVSAPLAPEVLEQLRAIGLGIDTVNGKTVIVKGNADDLARIKADLDAFLNAPSTKIVNLVTQQAPGPANAPGPQDLGGFLRAPGRAAGGAIYGGVPGKDSVPALLMPGEHVLTTADVSALGGQAGVYAMRQALHFATGGEVPGGTTPAAIPTPDTEIGVLIQIRDLLAGKGGAGSNPMAAMAANTATMATATKGATGGMGPFGTPLKKRGDPAYEMAAAAIQALGGDPEKWIGADPSTYVPPTALAGAGSLPGMPGMPGGASVDVAQLQRFALTGNTADLPAGLTINSPAVTAILAARNKKSGMGGEAISDLVGQALGPGGFSGTLDPTNTSLVKALEKLRTKGLPGAPAALAAAAVPGAGVTSGASGLVPAAATLAQTIRQLFPAVTEIGGVRQDAHPDHPSGRALDIMIPGGTVRGGVNPQGEALGDQMWAWLQSSGIIDPQGSLWKTDTGGDHYNHIHARIAEGMENAAATAGLMPGAGMAGSSLGAGAGGQGTPVYVTNWPGQGGMPPGVGQILGAGFGAAGQAAGTVATDITGAIASTGQEPWRTRKPAADLNKLLDEGNPMALAAAMGLNVQDFTRQGGAAGDTQSNDQKYDASGRLIGDTTSLMDRTFTDLQAQLSAMREQLVDVIEQTNQKLNDTALEPVIKAGMQSALESLKDSVSSAIGTALGQAAAPPIADAVKSAIPAQTAAPQASGNAQALTVPIPGMADGGPISGGTPGVDSVPALLMPGEFVLNRMDVARMGGTAGVEAARSKGFKHFAKGGKVVNDVVGAEFFGVSEVPILGAIINLIIGVLLKVIGVEIEARNTMTELTDEFRGFRGDAFKAFDATGRLLNDTSALMDRTSTSTEAAAEERIRILKIVIEAVIKYIIEKIIVPIGKAVANAAIQAGASAAGAAVNTQAPGAGGIVSSLISSGGQAGVEIVAEVGSDFAIALTGVLTDVIANGIQGAAPDLVNAVFGGGFLAALFDPAGGFLSALTGGLFGIISAVFGGLFGGASTLIPGIPFDNGGLARGKGVMLKDVNADELVLDPAQTDVFQRFVRALENGGFGGSNTTHVSAPITIIGGGRETADQVENRLLKLMP